MRKPIVLGVLAVVAIAAVTAMPAGREGSRTERPDRVCPIRSGPGRTPVTYTANPDGSHVEQLFSAAPSEEPRWSPDGSEVAILAPCTDGQGNCATTIVNPDTGTFRQLKMPDPSSSPAASSGRRTANDSPARASANRTRAGTASTRSAPPTAAGSTRITSNPGGEDFRRVLARRQAARLHSLGPRGRSSRPVRRQDRRQPSAPDHASGDDRQLVGRLVAAGERDRVLPPRERRQAQSLWVVHSDGSGLREIGLQAQPACGGPISNPASRGCIHPRWSPDGKKIIFSIFTAARRARSRTSTR